MLGESEAEYELCLPAAGRSAVEKFISETAIALRLRPRPRHPRLRKRGGYRGGKLSDLAGWQTLEASYKCVEVCGWRDWRSDHAGLLRSVAAR